jgi:hypothetical protein
MAKSKATKLPKKVAGVKIPKELRKAGQAAAEWVRGPVISEIAAAAMMAAAASLADSKKGRTVRRDAADLASESVREASAVGTAVKRALIDAARSLLDDYEGGSKPAAKAQGAKRGASPKKETTTKRRGSRAAGPAKKG